MILLPQGRTPPPFVPAQKGEKDTSNFDQEFTTEKPTVGSVRIDPSLKDQCRKGFRGFSFTCDLF